MIQMTLLAELEEFVRDLSLAKTSSHSVDDGPMLSRQAKELLGDRRQEGGQPCGSVEPPLKDAGAFWDVGQQAA